VRAQAVATSLSNDATGLFEMAHSRTKTTCSLHPLRKYADPPLLSPIAERHDRDSCASRLAFAGGMGNELQWLCEQTGVSTRKPTNNGNGATATRSTTPATISIDIGLLLDVSLLEDCFVPWNATTTSPVKVLALLKKRQAELLSDSSLPARTMSVGSVDWQSGTLVSIDVDINRYYVAFGLANAADNAAQSSNSDGVDQASRLRIMAGNALVKAAENEPRATLQSAMLIIGDEWVSIPTKPCRGSRSSL